MMIVFWAVTPLQSAIFTTASISQSVAAPMSLSHSLLPVNLQSTGLATGFLKTAYGVLWLGQRLPAFTTREGALEPFEAQYSTKDTGQNVTWSSSTVQYSTDLTCHPAVWTKDPRSPEIIFDNGKGCRTSNIFLVSQWQSEDRFYANYLGYQYDGVLDYFLQGPECPRNASHNFLAIWQKRPPDTQNDTFDFTALFCEGSYYSQEVQANISLPDLSVVSVSPTGPKKVLFDQSFNRTHFEFLLATGVKEGAGLNPLTQETAIDRVELPDALWFDLTARLSNWGLKFPVTNMVAFAVGASRLPPEDYLKPGNLVSAFEAAHRLAFALAINSIMVPSNGTTNVISGWRSYQVDAVFLTTIFTVIVQATLLIVLALTVYLLILCRRRHSCLNTNPSSITAIMSLSRDRELLGLLRGIVEVDSHTFKNELQQHRFRLRYSEKTHDHVLGLETPLHGVCRVPEDKDASTSCATASNPEQSARPECPVELSPLIGLLFMSLLAALIVVLTVLRHKIDQNNGKSP